MTYSEQWISRDGEFVSMVLSWMNSLSASDKYRAATMEENKRHMDIVFYNSEQDEWQGIDVKKPKRLKRTDQRASDDTITVELLNCWGYAGWSRPNLAHLPPLSPKPRKVLQFFEHGGVLDEVRVYSLPEMALKALEAIGMDPIATHNILTEYSASRRRGKEGSVAELARINGWDLIIDGPSTINKLRTRTKYPDGRPQSDLFVTVPLEAIPAVAWSIPPEWRQCLTNALGNY